MHLLYARIVTSASLIRSDGFPFIETVDLKVFWSSMEGKKSCASWESEQIISHYINWQFSDGVFPVNLLLTKPCSIHIHNDVNTNCLIVRSHVCTCLVQKTDQTIPLFTQINLIL